MTPLGLATLLLQPLGSALCLLALALLFVLRRQRRRAALLVLIAAGWLWLWATPLAADRITGALESRYPMLAAQVLPTADVILLLGGDRRGRQHGCDPEPAHCSRTAFAAALFAAGRAPLVLASGAGNIAAQDGRTEAELMREQLIGLGVPDAAIIPEPTARNTRENMGAAAPLLRGRGARKILLVTSAMHMPRAMANARALRLEVIAAPSDFDAAVGQVRGARALWPRVDALMRSQRAFKEYLGLAHQRAWSADWP